jgi:threonylcarbamoyladenosine tRNA methylthiotransferase MtaB
VRAAVQAKKLAQKGFREIILTGIEISSYGKDLPNSIYLMQLIKTIAVEVPDTRLRLGSLDPSIFTPTFCRELGGASNLCRHFHLSLQSGCDATLLRMGRKYNAALVRNAISLLRDNLPDCGITVDLIVGFPGESDAEFSETMAFISSEGFSDMHIFKYSRRSGTRADTMPNQIDKATKIKRANIAASQAAIMTRDYISSQIGKTLEVLFETNRDGYSVGYSDNYIEVSVKGNFPKNSVYSVLLTELRDGRAIGQVAGQ